MQADKLIFSNETNSEALLNDIINLSDKENGIWRQLVDRLPTPITLNEVESPYRMIFKNKAFCDRFNPDSSGFFDFPPYSDLSFVELKLKEWFSAVATQPCSKDSAYLKNVEMFNGVTSLTIDLEKIPVYQESKLKYWITYYHQPKAPEIKGDRAEDDKLKALGQLAGGVAHDFNNQLMGIIGYAELLKDELVLPEHKQYLDSMIRACDRSNRLIRQLLDFSRDRPLKMVPFSSHEMLKDVVQLIKPNVDSSFHISTSFFAERDAVYGDSSQLNNVLINLSLNAIDAIRSHQSYISSEMEGFLSIETSNVFLSDVDQFLFRADDFHPGRYLSINVSDNGIGIDPDLFYEIFEPFYTTKGAGKGTGIGLAVVFRTIKKHGGAMRLESRPGMGSVMSVFLPCARKESNLEFKFEEPKLQKGNGSILVVDDEIIILELLADSLSALGYKVYSFNRAEEALSYYQKNHKKIDLVLMDYLMPDMNGTDLFKHLKEVDSSVKAYLLSGMSEDDEIEGLIIDGLFGFIQKPVTLLDLSWKVHAAVSSDNIESAAEKG